MASSSQNAGKRTWTFRRRFRRNAFGWRSQPAVTRVREAVREIKGVARREPVVAAAGAVDFLERVAPALEHVDSSSGAIGNAVNNAIETLVPIIRDAPAEAATRDAWLQRLWHALEADTMPYIERLGDAWGELCADAERAARWADWLRPTAELALQRDPVTGFFKGTIPCLSALLAAGQYDHVLDLLEHDRLKFWPYRRFGVLALAARGEPDAAIAYAYDDKGTSYFGVDRERFCETILLDAGRCDEAYERFGIAASAANTRLQQFRALAKRYPDRDRESILADLVAASPGEEGKWFATARSLGLFDAALDLARQSPTDPRTLTRAARDHRDSEPAFAREAGLIALAWLSSGYGYDITAADVTTAAEHALHASAHQGTRQETRALLEDLAAENATDEFVRRSLGRWLAAGA